MNTSLDASLQLDGVTLSNGIDYVLPEYELAPGERIVVARNPDALKVRYPDLGNVLGPYAGQLSNRGERIRLGDSSGIAIVDVDYRDSGAWPERADGVGASVVIRTTDTAREHWHSPSRWRASTEFGGSPGQAEAGEPAVVINEVLAATQLPVTVSDTIELYNRSMQTVEIGGWYLSDSRNDLFKYQIPAGTRIGPNGYWTVDESQFNPSPLNQASHHFGLNGAEGDNVWLVVPDANGGIESFVDDVRLEGAQNGVSMGRNLNGSGPFAPLASPSLGSANGPSRFQQLAITEINYAPAAPGTEAQQIHPELQATDLEFIEVTSLDNQPTSLADWRLRGGVEYDFGDQQQLAAGESLLVVSFDPALQANAAVLEAFKAEYGGLPTATIVGPFQGRLSNQFDLIQLAVRDDQNSGPVGVLEDTAYYENVSPWPWPSVVADSGESLQRNVSSWGALPNAWEAAIPTPGAYSPTGIPGDITGDGTVDASDVDLLCDSIRSGGAVAEFDLDQSGSVDEADIDFLVNNILRTSAGDSNLDGRFDSNDLSLAFQAGTYEDSIPGNSNWSTGDWNCDGEFTTRDLVVALRAGAYRRI